MTIAEALPDLAPEIALLTLHRLISTLPLATADTAVDRAEREAEAIAALASLPRHRNRGPSRGLRRRHRRPRHGLPTPRDGGWRR
jgi:hypothetical protein